ncbi:helix-turn-helix domain-containing protein [Actinosynnema sp. NPDC023658]|uniref:helix-turn-helix domain-containing protein n=1 Tax=Actinosynnema sp. NPDC023658 TaxID=3155465 RepID=UPI0033DE1166
MTGRRWAGTARPPTRRRWARSGSCSRAGLTSARSSTRRSARCLDYDEARGTDLAQTLDAFCATGQSVTNTAQALQLHVNTVAQRPARIGRLLGESWREPERLLEVQIALRLLKVSKGQPRR